MLGQRRVRDDADDDKSDGRSRPTENKASALAATRGARGLPDLGPQRDAITDEVYRSLNDPATIVREYVGGVVRDSAEYRRLRTEYPDPATRPHELVEADYHSHKLFDDDEGRSFFMMTERGGLAVVFWIEDKDHNELWRIRTNRANTSRHSANYYRATAFEDGVDIITGRVAVMEDGVYVGDFEQNRTFRFYGRRHATRDYAPHAVAPLVPEPRHSTVNPKWRFSTENNIDSTEWIIMHESPGIRVRLMLRTYWNKGLMFDFDVDDTLVPAGSLLAARLANLRDAFDLYKADPRVPNEEEAKYLDPEWDIVFDAFNSHRDPPPSFSLVIRLNPAEPGLILDNHETEEHTFLPLPFEYNELLVFLRQASVIPGGYGSRGLDYP